MCGLEGKGRHQHVENNTAIAIATQKCHEKTNMDILKDYKTEYNYELCNDNVSRLY